MSVPLLDNHDAETIAAALIVRVELDGGDANLENELAKFGVGGGNVPVPRPAPTSREERYAPGRLTHKVQEASDDADELIDRLAKAYDQRRLATALHTRLVADGNAPRAANILTALKNFRVL